ncbi:flagellar biosynthesis protein FlhB [Heliobacillus mobilis]|uniref:Flagellar biosynthetic protein FlhB n=1 Tax=Heliobacterium mobile TaxID=28064 RepID=A0A6I3SBV2_HELMO|nr:flagellar biosynthesis protein FlhB [Heliobacterium mobile]MTV47812.1 flagellar biosynthesis protein FlhB [Heliobacterium mobile]
MKPVLKWDLQWFSGEKTEKPTGKRRSEARKKGQVARSSEINTALSLLFSFVALKYFGLQTFDGFERIMVYYLSTSSQENLSPVAVMTTGLEVAIRALLMVAPFLLVALTAGILASYLQVGFLFSLEGLKMNWGKLNPLNGLGRIFSKQALVELVKSLGKVTIIGYVAYSAIIKHLYIFPTLIGADIQTAIASISEIAYDVGFRVALLLIAVAALDYWFQWYSHEESLKMSKQEVKEEHKQSEGDPQIKGKIRQRMREVAMRRMMQELPKADVVITNPTHFAIALKYEGALMTAPVVIAKGQDYVALKIKEIAQSHGIPTVEDRPLAQALYRTVEIGQEIPAELFQAVAEVFAFVYRLKKKKA